VEFESIEAAVDKPLPRHVAEELAREPGKPTGRPLDLTDETAEEILNSIAQGSFLTVAAAKAGVATDTVYAWLRRGAGDKKAGLDTIFVRFIDAISRAQHAAEASAVAALQRGGDGKYKDWRAQAWWLERRHKDRWSLPKEQANQGLTLQLSNEQLAALGQALQIAAKPVIELEPEK